MREGEEKENERIGTLEQDDFIQIMPLSSMFPVFYTAFISKI